MLRRPPRSTQSRSSAASDVYKRQVVLSAPSGGGKTTLCQEILARHPEMVRIVTCTTRPPRPGEVEARDYFFLDYPTFAERLSSGGFLEHATVYNHFYGIPRAEVLHKLS